MSKFILEAADLTRPWAGVDPFLFCAYHVDHYPQGNAQLGMDASTLADRALGNDFSGLHGYNMYYGESVPGFPSHPHRGFETVTIVRRGYVDHADSLGAIARYGQGDVQWLTAGAGIQHAEMFPLLHDNQPNTLELLQIWLNLPARSKMVKPAFNMLWAEQIPHHRVGGAEVVIIAGAYQAVEGGEPIEALSPPPDSWGADPAADLALWLVRLAPGSELTLPAGKLAGSRRTLYVFEGSGLHIGNEAVGAHKIVYVDANHALPLVNHGQAQVQILLMQGVPLQEPVAAAGPFVMNTAAELNQARADYARTQFGGWPWDTRAPVHGASLQRFVRYPGDEVPGTPPAV